MENCEIRLNLGSLTLPSSLKIEIYRLENSPVHTNGISYHSRPQRTQKLAEVTGIQWRHNTTCALEELLSFELACLHGCNLQWLQAPEAHDGPGE